MKRKLVPTNQRMQQANALFGLSFPFKLEPLIYNLAGNIAEDYNGGYWDFYTLDNDGFYMAPGAGGPFGISCENGYEGMLSADAFGITVCLYAYSLLSFESNDMAKVYAQHYHRLREYYVKPLKHSLNLAIDWDMLLDINPAVRVPLFSEADNIVENYLGEAELERLMNVLQHDDNRAVCRIILFLLSSGARLNEALSAKWSQVDTEKRVWTIPSSNSKSKRVRSVPLNDSAISVLNHLDTKGKFEHLFINRQTGMPYTTISKVWGRLRKKAQLKHLRIHDFRRQYASFLVNDGRTLYEVQQILGHSDPSVTQRYAHLSTEALQDAANSASEVIQGAMRDVG